ncbi:MAG: septal ring lytic transglycosylase RlpA family protein [Burkholderiales bacterium]
MRKITLTVGCLCTLLVTSAMGAHQPSHRARTAAHAASPTQVGLASYYGKGFQGKKTADGEKFDKNELVAAHPTYPMGTQMRVTNLRNGRMVTVRVNDRGPAQRIRAQGVIVDLSEEAASQLGFRRNGKTRVKTEVVAWGKPAASSSAARAADGTGHTPTVAKSD